MSTYLLLRDNKQSGPYSLDEIKAKGFKKYDLVWVDGKSAAWRYPGELEEFKLLAPVVEEQPFDRFFKKPSQEKQSTNISQQINISQAPVPKVEVVQSAVLPQVVVETWNKKVYAVLPAKKTTTISTQETFSYQPVNKEPIKKEEPKPALNDYLFAEKEPEILRQNTRQYPERAISQKNINPYRRYIQPALLVACVLALLGGGIFIGMSISKGDSNQATKTDATEKQVASVSKPDAQNVSIPVSSSTPAEEKPAVTDQQKPATVNDETKNNNLVQQKNAAELEKKSVANNEKKKINSSKENSVLPAQKTMAKLDTKTDTDSYVSVPHREATHRTDAIDDKELIKNNIANLVSISSNKYHVGTFGGISEVQLTVSNKSIYPLDLVMVEVQYVQANKKIFKTENVYFHNIQGGESMMLEAPESSRGIKVQYRVTLINSKEASISYSGI